MSNIDFFYNGILRFDLGFHNPNKTAALLVQIILVILFLLENHRGKAFIRILQLFLLPVSFFFLLKTFSRGGLVAFCCTVIPYLYLSRIKYTKRFILYLIILFAMSILWATKLGVHNRIKSFLHDASVINRVEIWKNVPNMIFDAPYGWGYGNAGKAYMLWYQKIGSKEKYRTLVNSHFTWLVESGWTLRIIYIFLWLLIFYITFPYKANFSLIPFLVWLAFAISAFFSSTAENPYLWIIPIISLIYVIFIRLERRIYYSKHVILILLFISTIIFLPIYFCKGESDVYYNKKFVQIGNGTVKLTVFIDPIVAGEYAYAKELRRIIQTSGKKCAVVVCDNSSYPEKARESENIIIMGRNGKKYLTESNSNTQRIFLINPSFTKCDIKDRANTYVYIGEFSTKCSREYWDNFFNKIEMAGIGDFCPNIWEYIPMQYVFN